MTADTIHFLVEEPSMEAFLRGAAPKLIGSVHFEVYAYNGKADLLRKLPARLQGYSNWMPDGLRVVVVVDRDQEECTKLKARLEQMAADAGLATRRARTGGAYQVVTAIAIEELEAWYFGDWKAVRTAYPNVHASAVAKAGHRDPDAILGGTWEAFERVAQSAGYFAGGLRKVEAARAIGPHIAPASNSSRSFCYLRDVLAELVKEAAWRSSPGET